MRLSQAFHVAFKPETGTKRRLRKAHRVLLKANFGRAQLAIGGSFKKGAIPRLGVDQLVSTIESLAKDKSYTAESAIESAFYSGAVARLDDAGKLVSTIESLAQIGNYCARSGLEAAFNNGAVDRLDDAGKLVSMIEFFAQTGTSASEYGLHAAFKNGAVERLDDAGKLVSTIERLAQSGENDGTGLGLEAAFNNGAVERLDDAGELASTIEILAQTSTGSARYGLKAAFNNGAVDRLDADQLVSIIQSLAQTNTHGSRRAIDAAFKNGLVERGLGFVVDCGFVGAYEEMKGCYLAIDPEGGPGELVLISVGKDLVSGKDPISRVEKKIELYDRDILPLKSQGASNVPGPGANVFRGLETLGQSL